MRPVSQVNLCTDDLHDVYGVGECRLGGCTEDAEFFLSRVEELRFCSTHVPEFMIDMSIVRKSTPAKRGSGTDQEVASDVVTNIVCEGGTDQELASDVVPSIVCEGGRDAVSESGGQRGWKLVPGPPRLGYEVIISTASVRKIFGGSCFLL